MIAQELEVVLHNAFIAARYKRQQFITVEHLLLALLDGTDGAGVLRSCGADIEALRQNLAEHIARTPVSDSAVEFDTQPNMEFQRVIQRAIVEVQSCGRKEVNSANVVLAIYGEKDSHALHFLQQQSIARLDVANYITHGITNAPHAIQGQAAPIRPA